MATKRATRSASTPPPRSTGWILSRVLVALLAVAAVAFAVEGGEYGSTDLWRLRAELTAERAAVDSLTARVAELEAYREKVARDPATQERIAREEFGMLRPGEVLYRFAEPE